MNEVKEESTFDVIVGYVKMFAGAVEKAAEHIVEATEKGKKNA